MTSFKFSIKKTWEKTMNTKLLKLGPAKEKKPFHPCLQAACHQSRDEDICKQWKDSRFHFCNSPFAIWKFLSSRLVKKPRLTLLSEQVQVSLPHTSHSSSSDSSTHSAVPLHLQQRGALTYYYQRATLTYYYSI